MTWDAAPNGGGALVGAVAEYLAVVAAAAGVR